MSDKELKIGIVGHGFVGQATDWGFNKKTSKFIVDPKNGTNIDQLAEFDPELIFGVERKNATIKPKKSKKIKNNIVVSQPTSLNE